MNYPIDMKPDRIRWKRTKGRQQLLLNKIYDAVTEEFTRDAMASLATVLAHLCIVTDVAKPEAIEAFGNAFDEARDMLSGERCQRLSIELDGLGMPLSRSSIAFRHGLPSHRGLNTSIFDAAF
jgi:hypothetical protein